MNKTLTTPISAEDIEGIEVGDVVFLDGLLVTCRDVAHRRLVELGRQLPVDIRDAAILHAGRDQWFLGTPGEYLASPYGKRFGGDLS